MKGLLSWLFPGGLVLVAATAVAYGPEGLVAVASRGFPWIAFGWAALLAGSRHRSRVVALILGLVALAAMASSGAGGMPALYVGGGLFALSAVVLVPFGDRGVFSAMGLMQIACVGALGVLGGSFLYLAPGVTTGLLAADLVYPAVTDRLGVPLPVMTAFVLAVLMVFVVALRRDGPVERGILWSVLAVALALCLAGDPGRVLVLFMGAGLTLGLSVLDPSSAWAYRDGLTGLPGRRALLRDLQLMRGSYATAVVDIDDFSQFNDRYGHDVGDQVLRMVASRLTKVPGGGRAYRYGGDEFALLFPGRTEAETLRHLGGFQRSLQDSPFGLRRWRRPRAKTGDPGTAKTEGGTPTRRLIVKVSVGVADSSADESAPEAVLKRADEAVHGSGRKG